MSDQSSRWLVVFLVCVLGAGCAPLRPVPLPTSPPTARDVAAHVKVGDVVRVTLVDHRRVEFRVTAVTAAGLVGASGRTVAYGDIVRLERETYDPTATKVAAGMGVVGVVAILLAIGAALGSLLAGG